jgi:peroxiredoxin family protein
MSAPPLFVLLCSDAHEKIQMAAMTASVAAVSERPVTVFVSMGAILAFERDKDSGERYQGGRFSEIMMRKGAPDAIGLFGQGRMLGDMRMVVCSMALDVMGWELDDLTEDLFDEAMGLTKFLSDAEGCQLITL